MKVYVVIVSWCDDAWVEGVFTSRENAEAYILQERATDRDSDFEVEEFTLNVGAE